MSKKNKFLNFKFNSKEIISIIIFFTIFLFIGIISVRGYSKCLNKRKVVNINRTLNFMGEENPIKITLNERIQLYDEKQELARIEKEKELTRKIEEEKKLEEEKLKQEKLKQEKLKKLGEKPKVKESPKSTKTAYLTFDDGPSEIVTSKILKILEDYNIKATFFVQGKMAEEYPNTLETIYNNGHSIGNHSYSHNYKKIYSNVDNFLQDIKKADTVFKSVLGENFETNLLRLPGGSFEKHKKKYVKAAEEIGYISYDWDALNGDAELPKKNKAQLVKRLKDTVKGKEELVILMHDTDTKMNTVGALPEIIEHLMYQGYEFKSLE